MTEQVERQIVLRERKHPKLWQAWKYWDELVALRKRHLLRKSAIERGASSYDPEFEQAVMDHMGMDGLIKDAVKMIVNYAQPIPCWEWITSIRGLKAGPLAAQLLAQIDDIGRFDTISKLWRFAGYAVIDGEKDHRTPGEKSPYDSRLKATCFLVAEQFVRQQTPGYIEIYYEEKDRQRRLHPVPLCRECGIPKTECKNKEHHVIFNDGHIHNRAWRKMIKLFLSHLWVVWREAEGLPLSLPYAQAILGHDHYIEPWREG